MSFKGTKPSERAGRHNPKTIGHIPGYPVGSTFENRAELSAAGVHAPLRAGIHGNQEDGAYSVVLSYGYEDDDDNGETFIYTGQGGRTSDSSILDKFQGKESWSGHQTSDQEWKYGNQALQISCARQKPVRVIRGAPRKHQELFKYAPSEGLRYDGLYKVIDARRDEGVTGFKTCKFLFQREPDQPPLPIQRYYNASAARSSRKPLKFSKITSTIAVPREKPARTPHTPLPPYRPSAIQIAKLHRKPIPHPTQLGSSRSPESSNEPLRTSPSSSSSFQLPESEKGKKKRLASLKLGAFSPEAYILAVSKSRKRLHEDIEYDSSDSDAMSGDGIGSAKRSPDERDVPSKWGTVMGKRKLPQTLNFKRMKI